MNGRENSLKESEGPYKSESVGKLVRRVAENDRPQRVPQSQRGQKRRRSGREKFCWAPSVTRWPHKTNRRGPKKKDDILICEPVIFFSPCFRAEV